MVREPKTFIIWLIIMKQVEFDFNVSDRYIYYVTNDGHVYKVDTRNGKTDECYYHIAHGYRRIRVTDIDTNKRRYIRVARLVGKYYVAGYNKDLVINHIDGNKSNDVYTNLEWVTIAENTQHAYDNDLVHDRGGWKSTPYNKRHGNTESSNI